MRKSIAFLLLFLAVIGGIYWYQRPKLSLETKFVSNSHINRSPTTLGVGVEIKPPGDFARLEGIRQIYQTFNNCGPATLSMALSFWDVDVSQEELGQKMRPYQNPKGDNDDKTIFSQEFVDWAREFGLEATSEVDGDLELLKTFTTNGIPVVVKTWLHLNDDVGHFRLVRGFDQKKQVIIQDDSYQGSDREISYYDLLSMWQPFNYDYIVVYPPEKESLVKSIIGEETDEKTAWQNALVRAQQEERLDSGNIYPLFNQSTAYYHLSEFQKATLAFEKVESRLPRRMLWYQIEPILAYQKNGNYDRVFQISDKILDSGNRAFPELYQIRGEIYLILGEKEKAQDQFKKALFYHPGFASAQASLEKL